MSTKESKPPQPEQRKKEDDVSYQSLCMKCGAVVGIKYTTAQTAPKEGKMRDGYCPEHLTIE